MIFTDERRRRGAVLVTPAIQMTAAASGSNGITVADDDDIDFGTGDFFLHWEGSLPDWTPTGGVSIVRKFDTLNGYVINISSAGVPTLSIGTGSGSNSYAATVSLSAVDNSIVKITASVIRETASAAGSVTFYKNGQQLGDVVAIPAGAPPSVSTALDFYVSGRATVRNAGNTISCVVGNFALSANDAEYLGTIGIPSWWQWGSNAAMDDNLIYELDTTTATGWDAAVTSDGTVLTCPGTGALFDADKSITGPSSGDYILYCTLSADSVAGSYYTFQLGGAGDAAVSISLGYNWETAAAEQNRVSVRIGSVGVAGPSVDYSAADIEIAVQYDSRAGAGNFFVKESGAWVFYGSAVVASPYKSIFRVYTGGNDAASMTISEAFIAFPNFVAIGDSICAGHNLFDPVPSYYAGDDNYLSTWMAYTTISGPRNSIIVNYGVGGEDSSEIDSRVASMLTKTNPRMVFLHASTNDYGAGFTNAQRSANIQSSIDKIVADGAQAVLLNAVYPNSGSGGYPLNGTYYKTWWDTFSKSITSAIIKIDIMADSGILDGNYMNAAYTQSDGTHPNVAGFELIGELINKRVRNAGYASIGATMALLPNTIPTSSATTWDDSSGNTGGGTLPAAGATKVTIRR